ncbi:metal ABC transporter solute-binding protein, Zn/Mn family [Actinoalloteichus hymeniacidonis]|uniref:ABC-type Zn2+ transport system, periplasmic component/surface adhesin n=1 Tax=Actinoalloteichus hymeniacidonis TaxID=340345 RepID=A0AAC9HKX9_9PSEU|nr:zinc ABC transporter substrate-binding protein [Actinoalloteichus hymeniacidonis]AOS61223.1 ABC-type Zn2+ transport system, periplasmic component/surface adhesin [Actinoalloteichus hymeniacidonis]MBB5910774.1 zinc/manganese transport system substrate-binding protein [Actinoalloteichus hymeniacidonis]
MRSRLRRPAALVGGLAVTALTLAACGDGGAGQQGDAGDGSLRVAASTNVWGSVAQAVGGDEIEVVAIIDDPSADPHSYESTPRDAAEVQDSDLVVLNGGGYDEFMRSILDSIGSDKPTVDAAELVGVEGHSHAHEDESGHGEDDHAHDDEDHADEGEHGHGEDEHAEEDHGAEEHADEDHGTEDHSDAGHEHDHAHEHGEDNEHVWYDVDTVAAVADAVAAELGELDPDGAETYTANAEAFHAEIDTLRTQIEGIGAELDGEAHILSTEPLGQYVFEQAGLHDVTPTDFLRAVDAETDPPAAAIAEINEAVDSGEINALVFNPQTETSVTSRVRERAEAAGIPVVEFTETLPADQQDYLAWMSAQVDSLSVALTP